MGNKHSPSVGLVNAPRVENVYWALNIRHPQDLLIPMGGECLVSIKHSPSLGLVNAPRVENVYWALNIRHPQDLLIPMGGECLVSIKHSPSLGLVNPHGWRMFSKH
jgi:gamma-glutamyl phosphate reductase